MKKTFLSVIALVFMLQYAISQEIAIARPLEDISLDGSFMDWQETVNWYRMEHFFGNDDESNEDFSAQFAVSYQEKQQLLHIAIEVLDDDFIGDNGQSHTTQDHMLLYVDALHNIQGGSPLFYVASDRVLEVHHKPGTYRTENHFLTLDKAKVARKRVGNRIQYEWEIQMEGQIKVNNTLGLDFMMIDHDQSSGNETLLLWKNGFGKSFGSQKLGDVVLLDSQTQTGKVSGSIDMEKLDPSERINSIDLVSKEYPNLWVKTMVDTTGHFQAILPIGQYKVSPNRYFTSPMYSSGFNQNTHKLSYDALHTFMVQPDTTISVSGIIVTKQPQPLINPPDAEGLPISYVSESDVDKFVATWQSYFDIPAVSVAVIRNNKVFYDKEFGVNNNFARERINDQTLFEAASITKSVFAVMVLRLAERGIIDLDKPLHEYLTFPNIEIDGRSKLLTARIVLGHRSGLPNWAWGGPGTWENGGEIQLNFEPGTAFGYSGEAFNYLGRVVEHITGKDLRTLYEQEVARPFKVKDSHFFYTDEQEDRFALGHMQQYPQVKEKERVASPASGMSTNAHLFKSFVLGLINERGLSKSSYQSIYHPYTELTQEQKLYDPEVPQHVSHGFFVQRTPFGKLIAHGGNNGDYDCKFIYSPEQKFGFIVFTNSNLGDEFTRALEEFLLPSSSKRF